MGNASRLLVVGAALALGGCGGEASAEDRITELLKDQAADPDPSDCTESQTLRFTEEFYSEIGEDAIRACEEAAAEAEPYESDILMLRVDGDRATAEVTFEDAPLDVVDVLQLELVEEGETWKVDAVAIPDFDRTRINQSFVAFVDDRIPEPGLPPLRNCVINSFKHFSDEEAEAFILKAQGNQQELLASCLDQLRARLTPEEASSLGQTLGSQR